MPTYEYKCEECGGHWEQEQGIKDAPLDVCPFCSIDTRVRVAKSDGPPSKGKPKRLISGRTGFVLNGSGWARDGYKGHG